MINRVRMKQCIAALSLATMAYAVGASQPEAYLVGIGECELCGFHEVPLRSTQHVLNPCVHPVQEEETSQDLLLT